MSAHEDHALSALVRNLVDDLGTLVAGHVRLARAELAAHAEAYGRRVALVALAAALLFVGYALACVAAALALAPRWGGPVAFLVVGGAQLVAAGAGLGLVLGRASTPPLDESFSALDRTVATLAANANGAPRLTERPRPDTLGRDGLA